MEPACAFKAHNYVELSATTRVAEQFTMHLPTRNYTRLQLDGWLNTTPK